MCIDLHKGNYVGPWKLRRTVSWVHKDDVSFLMTGPKLVALTIETIGQHVLCLEPY